MYERLDSQIAHYASELTADVNLTPQEARGVATAVAIEVRDPRFRRDKVIIGHVPLRARYDELGAFQRWMDLSMDTEDPAVTRARVIVQNYICFVYLPESLFEDLNSGSQPGSVLRRCAAFLTTHRVHAFRNAIAHADWTYSPDFAAIDFWKRDGSSFNVSQQELNFWQTLSRGVAYPAVTSLVAASEPARSW